MILTIAQYIEAIGSPDGRMRSLRRVAPVCDREGTPIFAMPGHGLVDFDITANGRHLTLRCPLYFDGVAAARLRVLAEKDLGLGGRFFTEWKVLRSEIVLFDAGGVPFEVDVLVRPALQGEGLAGFLERAAVQGNDEAVRAVRASFEELVRWADRVGRSGISLKRLRVGSGGGLFLTGFSATDERERIDGMLRGAAPAETAAPLPPADCEEWVWDESLGVATVMTEGRWGVADREGRLLTLEPYDWLGEYSEGLLLAQKGGKCGFLDGTGREVIPFVYDDASSFFEGCAPVSAGGDSFVIDRHGDRI